MKKETITCPLCNKDFLHDHKVAKKEVVMCDLCGEETKNHINVPYTTVINSILVNEVTLCNKCSKKSMAVANSEFKAKYGVE
jgi:transcription elongation factor Elf1